MTNSEINLLIDQLSSSKAYLEFGCGGSTKYAVDYARGSILSVESDTAWVKKLSEDHDVATALQSGRLTFLPIDIGPVGDWGVPRDQSKIKNWSSYYTAPWRREAPLYDFILIDGRFRVMCALMAVAQAQEGAAIAIHDYRERPHYFVVERYLEVLHSAGTLVVFKKKTNINYRDLILDIERYALDYN
jgi:hypothetical protein